MAVRIRADGTVLCAAQHPERDDDRYYIDDGLHYLLSAELKVLVTEPHERHREHGQWWWRDRVPENVDIDEFYEEVTVSRSENKEAVTDYIQRRQRGDARDKLLAAAAGWLSSHHYFEQAQPGPNDDAEMEMREELLLTAAREFVAAYAQTGVET